MKKIIRDYFSFNSRERVAIILLCCLMAFFWVLPEWYQGPQNNVGLSGKLLPAPLPDSSKKSEDVASKKLETNPSNVVVKLFEFDPNELSEEGWKKLGIRDKTIQTILHYRQKGGRFHRAEDLKKIWGMQAAEAERLMPYVSIQNISKPIFKSAPSQPIKSTKPIHINQATAEEISALPGLNRSLAARMVKFRDKLGGFQNLDQVRRTYGITDSIFLLISPLIIFEE
ncbi:MAG: helix-hairpin-helix domain-containing protein [Bacteroidetes bacterium]|nr:helix-hairpin-helix domain-containing protein [Bacteroidota bacterium]